MSAAGAVELVCERRGTRTVLTRTYHAGLARSSRLPRAHDGAAHVMLGTLGPGALRGDRFVTSGRVGPGASLLVTAQMATPVFPGTAATLESCWEVGSGATLCVVSQPLVPLPGSSCELALTIDVAADGIAIVAETLAFGRDARVRARTIGRLDGTVVLRDILELRAANTPADAVGSVYVLVADAALRTRMTAHAWALAEAESEVRAGVGGCSGALVVRMTGPPFAVGRATAHIAQALRAFSGDRR